MTETQDRAVDPGIQAMLDAIARMGNRPTSSLQPSEARAGFKLIIPLDGEPAPVDHIEDRSVPGPAGPIPVRIYRPTDRPAGVLVWYHGGGFTIGDLDTADPTARKLAAGSGCVVVSVDYRLAPEHPFPAATDDAWAVLRWVADHAAEIGGDPTRLAVGGDSAGGNISALMAIRARDEGVALRHQLLVYPATGLTDRTGSRIENGEGYFLTDDTMTWFEANYLQGHDASDPAVSPFQADLTGVAPTHILTAGFDPLRDEGDAYADKLAAAGVPVEHDRFPTMIHGFFALGMITPVAGEAMASATKLLAAALE